MCEPFVLCGLFSPYRHGTPHRPVLIKLKFVEARLQTLSENLKDMAQSIGIQSDVIKHLFPSPHNQCLAGGKNGPPVTSEVSFPSPVSVARDEPARSPCRLSE